MTYKILLAIFNYLEIPIWRIQLSDYCLVAFGMALFLTNLQKSSDSVRMYQLKLDFP